MRSAIRYAGGEVGDVEVSEPAAGHVRSAIQTGRRSHPRHVYRTSQSAEIEQVGLNDLGHVVFDDPAETSHAALLLAERDLDVERVGYSLRLVVIIEGRGLFEEGELLLFHHPANLDGHRNVVR